MVNHRSAGCRYQRLLSGVCEQIETRVLLCSTPLVAADAQLIAGADVTPVPDQCDMQTLAATSDNSDGPLCEITLLDFAPTDLDFGGVALTDEIQFDEAFSDNDGIAVAGYPDDFASRMFMLPSTFTSIEITRLFEASLVVDTWPQFDDEGNLVSAGTLRNLTDDAVYDTPTFITLFVGESDPGEVANRLGISDFKLLDSHTLYIPVSLSDGLDVFRFAASIDVGPGSVFEITLFHTDGDHTEPQVISLSSSSIEVRETILEIPPYVRYFQEQFDDGGELLSSNHFTPKDGTVWEESDGTPVDDFGDKQDIEIDDLTLQDPGASPDEEFSVEAFYSFTPGSAELQRGGGSNDSLTPATVTTSPQVANNSIPVASQQSIERGDNTRDIQSQGTIANRSDETSVMTTNAASIPKRIIRPRHSTTGHRNTASLNRNQTAILNGLAPPIQGLDSGLGTTEEAPAQEPESDRSEVEDTSTADRDVVQTGAESFNTPVVGLRRDWIDQFMSDFADDSFFV